jgi:hypothetical protein
MLIGPKLRFVTSSFFSMRDPALSPSLVPSFDVTVYLVLDDFGKLGRAYREAAEEKSDLDTIIECLLVGEYKKPVRVVAFNTVEGWSRDVSEEVAWEVLSRASSRGSSLPLPTHNFVSFHVGERAALEAENSLL